MVLRRFPRVEQLAVVGRLLAVVAWKKGAIKDVSETSQATVQDAVKITWACSVLFHIAFHSGNPVGFALQVLAVCASVDLRIM